MRIKFLAILKILTTFAICFSLLSIHIEQSPQGKISIEFESAEAQEEDGGFGAGAMSMITMLAIGVVAWRLMEMCSKWPPDVMIAAAAGAIYIAGEASAIGGHGDDSEEGAGDYNEKANNTSCNSEEGDSSNTATASSNGLEASKVIASGAEKCTNESAQTDAFRAQKKQAEDTKGTGETKLMLQAAAAAAFAIAAAVAFAAAAALEAEVLACEGASETSEINNGLASTASEAFLTDSELAELSVETTISLIVEAIVVCEASSKSCNDEGIAKSADGKQLVTAGTAELNDTSGVKGADDVAAGETLEGKGASLQVDGAMLESSTDILGTALGLDEIAEIKVITAAEDIEAAQKFQLTAVEEAEKAKAAAIAIGVGLEATEPSKVIADIMHSEVATYEKALIVNNELLGNAELDLSDAKAELLSGANKNASALENLWKASAVAAGVLTCVKGKACQTSITQAISGAGATQKAIMKAVASGEKAIEVNATAMVSAVNAQALCSALSITLEEQIAVCEPSINAVVSLSPNSLQNGDRKVCRVDNNNPQRKDSLREIIPSIYSFEDVNQNLLAKLKNEKSSSEIFKIIANEGNEFLLSSVKAQGTLVAVGAAAPAPVSDGLGLVEGPVAQAVDEGAASTSFEWDYLLASPGNRAKIWLGLAAVTAAAAMQTNGQIADKEEEIEEINEIISRLENLDKSQQSKATKIVRESRPTELDSQTTDLRGNFDTKPNGTGISVNDRLKDIAANTENVSLPVIDCLKKDENGKCESLALSFSKGDFGLSKSASQVGKLADSLSNDGQFGDKSRLLAADLSQQKSAIDRVVRKQIKKLNNQRKLQGKEVINFRKDSDDFLNKIKGKVSKALKKNGLSPSKVATGLGNAEIKAGLLEKLAKYKRRKRGSLKYSTKGKGINKNRGKGKYGLRSLKRSKFKKSRNVAGDFVAKNFNDKKYKRGKYDDSLNDIVQGNKVSLFGLISNRYNLLIIRERFGR